MRQHVAAKAPQGIGLGRELPCQGDSLFSSGQLGSSVCLYFPLFSSLSRNHFRFSSFYFCLLCLLGFLLPKLSNLSLLSFSELSRLCLLSLRFSRFLSSFCLLSLLLSLLLFSSALFSCVRASANASIAFCASLSAMSLCRSARSRCASTSDNNPVALSLWAAACARSF